MTKSHLRVENIGDGYHSGPFEDIVLIAGRENRLGVVLS
jgi:hypothetical protein